MAKVNKVSGHSSSNPLPIIVLMVLVFLSVSLLIAVGA